MLVANRLSINQPLGNHHLGHHEANHLHPVVWMTLGGAVLWSLAMSWMFWSVAKHFDYATIVLGLVAVMAFLLPGSIWLIGSLYHDRRVLVRSADAMTEPKEFGDWASSEFIAHDDHMKGSEAMTNMLMPVMAAPVLMTIFAIIVHLAAVRSH